MKNHFWRSLVLVLVVSLSLTACGKGCFSKGPREAFSLLPMDINTVVGSHWLRLQNSPIGAKLLSDLPQTKGFFVGKDVDLMVGMKLEGATSSIVSGVATGEMGGSAGMIEELRKQAEKNQTTLEKETYEGATIYYAANQPDFCLSFIDEKQVIFGSKAGVKASLDLSRHKGESLEKNKPMMDLVGGVDRTKMIWAVGQVPAGIVPAGGSAGEGNPMQVFSTVKSFDLAIDYPNDLLIVDLSLTTPSSDEATKIVAVVDSFKMVFGGLTAVSKPELGKLLNTLPVTAKGNKVTLSLKLDRATMDKLEQESKQPAPAPAFGDPTSPPTTSPTD